MVMVNGLPAIAALERSHGDHVELGEWRRYASRDRAGRTLRHREGHFVAGEPRVPLLAFPFLRSISAHNSYSEIDQLGAVAHDLIRRTSVPSCKC